MPDRRHSPSVERGQAVPVVLAAVAVLAVFLTALGWFGRSVVDAARARTAADAAALAGVAGGRAQAARLATANGGVLVTFEWRGADVLVRVRVGRATAAARATGAASDADAVPLPGPTLSPHGRARPPG